MRQDRLLPKLLVGLVILIVPLVLMVQILARTHPVYQQSLDYLEADSVATKLLGTPLSTGWWVDNRSGRFNAAMIYYVEGRHQSGHILVKGKNTGVDWKVTSVTLMMEDSGRELAIYLPGKGK